MKRTGTPILIGILTVALALGDAGCERPIIGWTDDGRPILGNPELSDEGRFLVQMTATLVALGLESRASGGGGHSGGHGSFGHVRPIRGRGHVGKIKMGGCGGRGSKSLEDGDVAKLTRPAGCPDAVLPHEAPTRPAKLFVYCEWDTLADMELVTIEPGNEVCGLKNELTKTGGMLDWDIESPFGPQTYMSGEQPPAGKYTIGLCRFKGDKGEGKATATVVVQQNARLEGWSAKRYKVTLPAVTDKPIVKPVAVVELK